MRFKGWFLTFLFLLLTDIVAYMQGWTLLLVVSCILTGAALVMCIFGAAADEDDPDVWWTLR